MGSLGPPAGLLFFATAPHRTGDVRLEPEGPWADHSSLRKSSSSSESVSAVKVVFSKVSHQVGGCCLSYCVAVSAPWLGTDRSTCLLAPKQAARALLLPGRPPGPLQAGGCQQHPQHSHLRAQPSRPWRRESHWQEGLSPGWGGRSPLGRLPHRTTPGPGEGRGSGEEELKLFSPKIPASAAHEHSSFQHSSWRETAQGR